jgi:hypothetical protein
MAITVAHYFDPSIRVVKSARRFRWRGLLISAFWKKMKKNPSLDAV